MVLPLEMFWKNFGSFDTIVGSPSTWSVWLVIQSPPVCTGTPPSAAFILPRSSVSSSTVFGGAEMPASANAFLL